MRTPSPRSLGRLEGYLGRPSSFAPPVHFVRNGVALCGWANFTLHGVSEDKSDVTCRSCRFMLIRASGGYAP